MNIKTRAVESKTLPRVGAALFGSAMLTACLCGAIVQYYLAHGLNVGSLLVGVLTGSAAVVYALWPTHGEGS